MGPKKINKMTLLTMDIEDAKLDIINWVKKIQDESLIYKLEKLRAEQFDFEDQLTEDQKTKIMHAISTLRDDQG